MTFSKRLWQSINPYYLTIAAHPFNVEMVNGTLSRDRFEFYIQQDVSYLDAVSVVYTLIAHRATTACMNSFFLTLSQDTQAAGRNLETLFLGSCKYSPDAALSPACKEYSNYLCATAESATLEESVAAILPCLWIYRELSKKMASTAAENNPYWQWIALNASQTFSDVTDQVISFVDEIAGQCSEETFGLMEEKCECSSRFEWCFWEAAYQMNTIQTEGSET